MGRARTAVAIAVAAAVGSGAAVTVAALRVDEGRDLHPVHRTDVSTTVARVDASALVTDAFAAKRPVLLAACAADPAVATGVTFDVTVGADGTVLAWGVNESREAAPGLGQCLRQQQFDLDVEPTGETIRLELVL